MERRWDLAVRRPWLGQPEFVERFRNPHLTRFTRSWTASLSRSSKLCPGTCGKSPSGLELGANWYVDVIRLGADNFFDWFVGYYLQTLTRPMNADDWRIFQAYAFRVRTIACVGHYNIVDAQVLRALSFSPTPGPLFPNLISFQWRERQDEAFPFISHVLHGSLTQLTLNLSGPEIITLSLLPSIKSICTNVTKATFGIAGSWSEAASNAISNVISGWSHLEELECGGLSQPAWQHLATLPSLRVLTIEFSAAPFGPYRIDPRVDARSAFSALETLILKSWSLTSYHSIIAQMQYSPLKAVICQPSIPFTPEDFRTFAQTLSNDTTQNTLDKFFVDQGWAEGVDYADYILSIDALIPLSQLRNLTSLRINPLGPLDLNDEDLNEMSKHLSHLHTLILGSTHGCRDRSKITLEGLVPLLRNCPKLIWLGIVIDATVLPSANANSSGGEKVRNHHLNCLLLGDSKIDDAARVATYLSDLLPGIRDIFSWDENMDVQPMDREQYEPRWNEVARLIPIYAQVRAQAEEAD